MYPKQPSFQIASSTAQARQQKREQVARLLISKFRNKFNINMATEQSLDTKLIELINTLVKNDEILGEK